MIKHYCDKCGDVIESEKSFGNGIDSVLGRGEFCNEHCEEAQVLIAEFHNQEVALRERYREMFQVWRKGEKIK